tara:strand:+ start:213 stop:320 length:108 start_codon:yes stop_codon:yes gene_type:complete
MKVKKIVSSRIYNLKKMLIFNENVLKQRKFRANLR